MMSCDLDLLASIAGNDCKTAADALHRGADVSARFGVHRRTPLHLAAQQGKAELVHLLLAFNANVKSWDRDKNTPLHLAAEAGHKAVVKLLHEAGARIDDLNGAGETPLLLAAYEDRTSVIIYLTKYGANIHRDNNDNWTPLHAAAACRNPVIVRFLIAQGANPKRLTPYLQTVVQSLLTKKAARSVSPAAVAQPPSHSSQMPAGLPKLKNQALHRDGPPNGGKK